MKFCCIFEVYSNVLFFSYFDVKYPQRFFLDFLRKINKLKDSRMEPIYSLSYIYIISTTGDFGSFAVFI